MTGANPLTILVDRSVELQHSRQGGDIIEIENARCELLRARRDLARIGRRERTSTAQVIKFPTR
jgi:hypothetical protein